MPRLPRAATPAGAGPRQERAEKLNTAGEYEGQHLSVTLADGSPLEIDLPAESFVAEAHGDALVYTRVDGGHSQVRLIDLATGCDSVLARPKGIVRSALMDADGAAVYVHAVSVGGRQDLGVTRYSLDGGSRLVVPPLDVDGRFGPTFGTRLAWSTDNSTLVVQSCGLEQCRTRLLDANGALTTFDADGQGELIAVTPRYLVAYAACAGLPCAVTSIDRSDGVVSQLAAEAWSTQVTPTADGAVISIETADSSTIEVSR